ncbi:receptor kinase-like protein Xa21 [Eucalyptus grandis]|uniref:receptor kinase-like protein Xa21 n=1 Tax=Eucalyptus grandis TaxID=71139 RepID=UPI00192E883C|nr:receptor kinase-like protein Xa21 [Eucalyptus grandis]
MSLAMQTNQTDQLALIYFKDSVDKDSLGILSSWNDSSHHCEWPGIVCGGRHPERVVSLNLMSKGLGGLLSPHVGNLSFLRSLVLQNNSFRGKIPQSIGHLFRLRHLVLSNNSFSGQMPTNLSQCSNLEVLNLIDNQLVGKIPHELGSLSKLRALFLAKNSLTGSIPCSIGNLSQLFSLSVGRNGLQGEIPETLSKLRGLRNVQLAFNQLTGKIPPAIFNMSSIIYFSAGDNQLRGSIPPNIGATLPSLDYLDFSRNLFTGVIPPSLSNASNLQYISFDHNNFHGPMPTNLGRLKALEEMFLMSNQLRDDFSFITSLTNCSMLEIIGVDHNFLEGLLPDSIGNLSNSVRLIAMSSNTMYGTIPPSIGNLFNLSYLDLSNNSLSGHVPSCIGALYNLRNLYLSINMLTGEIPSLIGNLTLLSLLYLPFNNFYGEIPQSLGNCRQLIELELSNNNLEWSNPEGALGTLRGLQELDVSHNDLFGEIPSFLTQLMDLKYLNLSSNKLEGEVPKQAVFLNVSAVFVYENRNLCGGKGRYGTVYKATTQEGGWVAIKVLNLGHRGASKSFISECRTLGAIRHRNLVKILDVCSSVDYHGNDFKALLYEYMGNGSLENWIHQGNEEDVVHEHGHGKPGHLGLIRRLDIAIDIAFAIEYLHKNCSPKIVHGDLKLSNILLDNEMVGRVGDFGMATICFSATTEAMDIDNHSSSVAVRGSIGYVPPEYGMGDTVSTQGDMYSYGIVLLEMLTGRRPTEEAFKDHLNLHNFVKVALPNRVMEIVDSAIFNGESENDIGRLRDCVTSVLRIGVACSMESPRDRMDVTDALKELRKIQARYG